MKMKPFDTMSEAEFDTLLNKIGADECGDLTTDQVFTALDSLRNDETGDTLELDATISDGQLIFVEPAPLYAHANELRIGNKRIIIRLIDKAEQDVA